MEETHYTVWVVGFFVIFAIVKVLSNGRDQLRHYHRTRLLAGGGCVLAAALFFWLSLDDEHDLFRWKHGVAQLLFGVALVNLWQVTAPNKESYNDGISSSGSSGGLPM